MDDQTPTPDGEPVEAPTDSSTAPARRWYARPVAVAALAGVLGLGIGAGAVALAHGPDGDGHRGGDRASGWTQQDHIGDMDGDGHGMRGDHPDQVHGG